MRLSPLDILIIAAYLAVIAYIAWRSHRFAKQGLESYFLGGRMMPGWLAGISYAASLMSADSAVAYGGMAVVTGVFVCWFYLARFGLAFFIGGVLFAVFWKRLNTFTTLEFYELRFSRKPASLMRLWLAIRTSLIAMVAWTAVALLSLVKIVEPILGLSRTAIILIVLPITIAYIYFSGFGGLVTGNLIQVAVIILGSLVLAIKAVEAVGGPHALGALLTRTAGKDVVFNIPPHGHPYFPLAAAMAWLLGTSIGYGGDAAPMSGAVEGQRILSTRSPREACEMYLTTEVSLFTMVWLVSAPCLVAVVLWPQLRTGQMDRELAYGMLMSRFLGPGLLGLVLVAVLAGVIGVVGDNLNFGSQVLMNDIYRRFLVRDASERHYFIAGRLCIFVILGLAVLVVYQVHYVMDVAIFMVGLAAAELSANWAQWWWWRFNGWGRVAASFGGGSIYVGLAAVLPQMKWWTRIYVIMIISMLLWLVVTMLTAPEPCALLTGFYNRAQPMGWWKPIRSAKSCGNSNGVGYEQTSGFKKIGSGLVTASVGAAAVMCYIVGISDLYVGRSRVGLIILLTMILLGFIFWRRFPRFVNSLLTTEETTKVSRTNTRFLTDQLGFGTVLQFGTATVALLSLVYTVLFAVGADRCIGLGVALLVGALFWRLRR
jgi:solute:Na+ symporter, SSS family